jgi:periplasmic nitrate reductase NapD
VAEELHISSIVVHVRPEAAAGAAQSIAAMRGAEVHQQLAGGKLIVTLETASTDDIMQHIERINELPGVVTTALVYHHWESVSEAESEADHEAHPPQVSQS